MAETIIPPKESWDSVEGLDPSTPQPKTLATCELPDDDTPRDRRRRAWHTAKIEERRAKQRLNQSTKSPDRGGLMVTCSPVAETCHAPLDAYLDHDAYLHENKPHDRTHGQWKIIKELGLCAACLTRTIPSHKPSDQRAPCKGRLSVPFEDADIPTIRRELARHKNDVRRKGNANRMAVQSNGRRQQRLPVSAPAYGDKRMPNQNTESTVQYDYTNHSQQGGDMHAESLPFAPLYNFQDPSYYDPYHAHASLHGGPQEHSGARSQSSITLEHPGQVESVPDESQILQMLHPIDFESATPPKQSAVLDMDVMGMTPITPLIPTIHVEGETELKDAASHRIGFMPNGDIGTLMAPTSDYDRDWDSVTNVAEGLEQTKLQDTVHGDLSSSRLLVELFVDEGKVIPLPADRSWTLKGLYTSLVSSEWDDATMVEEPQELSPKVGSLPDRVLKSAKSFESFFATRQGAFWEEEMRSWKFFTPRESVD
ncbi:hypothetical protein DE146DRAFT_240414 [Phaeosphaeria sp. MPI-PUGE-AT-0046c]|nr:hypothetical protein DE146DRAFT_240414 [Phaeosphaeria sp. MPI-PUGE-AT-0046c]